MSTNIVILLDPRWIYFNQSTRAPRAADKKSNPKTFWSKNVPWPRKEQYIYCIYIIFTALASSLSLVLLRWNYVSDKVETNSKGKKNHDRDVPWAKILSSIKTHAIHLNFSLCKSDNEVLKESSILRSD